MKWLNPVLIAAALLLTAVPSRADVDQKCLGTCISNRNSSTACMSQCSYNVKNSQSQPPAGATAGSGHRVLEAPVPVNGVFLPAPSAKTLSVSKDYTCINQCLQAGMQYPLCERRCTKTSCGPGTTRCRDLTGASPNSVSSSSSSSQLK